MFPFFGRVLCAALPLSLLASTASAQPYDHLKCFKMKDVQTFSSANADIETIELPFGMQNCQIKKKAKLFCIPSSKTITEITDGADTPFPVPPQELVFEQVCYKLKCPNVVIADQQISDQFGTRTASRFKAKYFCTPGVIGLPPTTTTTTTTSTTTSTTLSLTAWSLRAGDSDEQTAVGVAVDSVGNAFALGYFAGQIDFGLGAMTSAGDRDVFLVKLNPAGTALWQAQFGDANPDLALDIAVDSLDNVYIAGVFTGDIDFGGGTLSATSVDGYLAKFNSSGTHQWSQKVGGTLNDFVYSIDITSADEVVLTGYFDSPSIDLGGGAIALVGSQDGYLAKLDSGGSHVWGITMGGVSATAQFTGVHVDVSGNVLVAGAMDGTIDYGGGALVSSGGTDAVVLKYTGAGAHSWSQIFGDGDDQAASNVTSGPFMGQVVVTGTAAGTTDFGGGALVSAGGDDVFVAQFDFSGVHQWSALYGDGDDQTAFDVTVDTSPDILVTGSASGAINFGGGALGGAGGNDAFVAELTFGGAHVSSHSFGGTGDEFAGGIAVDAANNRYVVGEFEATVDFGNGPLVSSGGSDAYIVKLVP